MGNCSFSVWQMLPKCRRDSAGMLPGKRGIGGWSAKFLKITHHTGRDTAIEHQIRHDSGRIPARFCRCDFTVSHCITVSLCHCVTLRHTVSLCRCIPLCHTVSLCITASHCVTQRLKTSCLFLFDSRGQENVKRLYETFAYNNTTYRNQPGKPTAQAVGVCHVLM